MATIEDFQKLDIRVGKIIEVEEAKEVKIPAYKIKIDFGKEVGIKKTMAQLTKNYTEKSLKNKLVLAVVNFPPRQIGNFMSEVLILGVPKDDLKDVILVKPDKDVPLGGKLY